MNNFKKFALALLASSAVFTISPTASIDFSPTVEIVTVINLTQ